MHTGTQAEKQQRGHERTRMASKERRGAIGWTPAALLGLQLTIAIASPLHWRADPFVPLQQQPRTLRPAHGRCSRLQSHGSSVPPGWEWDGRAAWSAASGRLRRGCCVCVRVFGRDRLFNFIDINARRGCRLLIGAVAACVVELLLAAILTRIEKIVAAQREAEGGERRAEVATARRRQ